MNDLVKMNLYTLSTDILCGGNIYKKAIINNFHFYTGIDSETNSTNIYVRFLCPICGKFHESIV